MNKIIRVLCVLALSALILANPAYCRQARYKQVAKIVIENGHPYNLDPDLYAVLDIGKDNIIKTTYTVKNGSKEIVDTQEMKIQYENRLNVTSTEAEWVTDIKKLLKRPVQSADQDIVQAYALEHARFFTFITAGESFMVETRNFCRYGDLDLTVNLVEYGYYERVYD